MSRGGAVFMEGGETGALLLASCSECQSLRHEVERLRQALSAEEARSAALTKDIASLHAVPQKNSRGGEG